MKKLLVILCALLLVGCSSENKVDDISTKYPDARIIVLNTDSASIDGVAINEYDYTWNVDPTTVHDEVKNAPAEYYTGEANKEDTIYIDHELFYYPTIDEDKFELVNYDGEKEWVYYYEDGENNDYIFSTLPNFNGTVPGDMMHTAEEASQNKVLHINEAGTYIIQGDWAGQIKFDLGEDAFSDETCKVKVVLNNVNIDCSVAPGIIFENVYECDNTWEEKEQYSYDVDLSDCGVQVIIADDSTNVVSGTNIFRMLKTKYKDDESTDEIKVQKKQRKFDGSFYSCVSMSINGEDNNTGTLEINSGFEGLDSELHLQINGGNITINSNDDGSNVNEDNVSVFVLNGGNLTINAALGAEGDGIDSNGYVVINGGNLAVNGVVAPDNSIDSEDGVIYNGGTITIDGEVKELEVGNYQEISSDNQGFGGGMGKRNDFDMGMMNNVDFDIKEFKEKVASLPDDATIQDIYELLGMGGGQFGPGEMPNDENFNPEDMKNTEGFNPGNMPNGANQNNVQAPPDKK